MPQSIVNQPTPSQVSGRLATWHRVMEEAGLEYADLQTPIDNPDFRVRLVKFWHNGGEAVVEAKPEPPQAPQFSLVPGINEPFDFEIDGDLNITPSGWKPLGPEFPKGKRVYRARLLDLGCCSNRSDAIRKIAQKAKELNLKLQAAPGQAREVFMAKYPRHNGRLIVMAGNEWQDSGRFRRVACLLDWGDGAWDPGFGFSGRGFDDVCLWLVLEQVDA